MNYLSDLQQLILINSYTRNKSGVDKAGRLFDTWMKPLGFSVTIHPRESIGEHRHYTTPVKAGKRLLLLGHLDTVFPPSAFDHYDEDDAWIYGPGACDMKGGNIVALQALRNVRNAGIPIHNVDMLLVSDEETGSDDSKLLSRHLAKDYDYCLVFEAAGPDMEVVTARKGVGTFTIDIEGLAKHAGNHYADGIDANLEASHKLQALVALTDLEKGTTVNVGKMEGGIGANTISPHAHLLFELRYKTANERDQVLNAIDSIVKTSYVAGTQATLCGGIQRDVMQRSATTEALVKDIERITGTALATEERGGVSDANIFSAEGVVSLDGFGPYGDGDHTRNERASKQSFEERIALTETLLKYFIAHCDFREQA